MFKQVSLIVRCPYPQASWFHLIRKRVNVGVPGALRWCIWKSILRPQPTPWPLGQNFADLAAADALRTSLGGKRLSASQAERLQKADGQTRRQK